MKQIVFLISAFVVLLQLHSTTASADFQTGWDEIYYNIGFNTDTIAQWYWKLEEYGISALKDANVEVSAKWRESLDSDGKLLDEIKTKLCEGIDKLRKTAPVEWAEIKPEIDALMTEITLKLRELAKKIVDGVLGTQQEIDNTVSEVTEELKTLLETKTSQTENILKEAAQKNLNAKQSAGIQESQDNE